MSVPVVTVAQMRGWEDASWSAGRDINEVMRLAGAAVAVCYTRLTVPAEA